jgi:hypothetical protein
MIKEPYLPSEVFQAARTKAGEDNELLECIMWVETLTSINVSATQACSTWAAKKAREPLTRLDSRV